MSDQPYFHAIETLARRRAEVMAEIAAKDKLIFELNHAMETLRKAQLEEPSVYEGRIQGVCIICNGAGCSTCEPLPELARCKTCNTTQVFLNHELECNVCANVPRI